MNIYLTENLRQKNTDRKIERRSGAEVNTIKIQGQHSFLFKCVHHRGEKRETERGSERHRDMMQKGENRYQSSAENVTQMFIHF